MNGRNLFLFMFRYLLLTVCCFVFLPLQAQEAELHTFTDKSGQQVSASLISVSSDRQKMKIRREDGQEFELLINVLSLDDQQFIKERLDTVPVEQTEYRVEMEVSLKEVNAESYPYGETELSLTRNFFTYQVNLRSLSRETLEDAKLEWAIALDERIDVLPAEDGSDGWEFDRRSDSDLEIEMNVISGEVELSSVRYNEDIVVTTDEIELNEMILDDEVYVNRADTLLGAILRLVDANGTVILEERIGDSDFEGVSWDEAIALVMPAQGS